MIARLRYGGCQISRKAALVVAGSTVGDRLGQRLAVLRGDFCLERLQHLFRFRGAALLREPARAFRHAPANRPHHQRAERADDHHPAPAVDAERRLRHQPPRKQRDRRYGCVLHQMDESERAAAQTFRHEFADVGIDRHQFDAHADASDQPPQVDSRRAWFAAP